jgi:hypothetical protein
VVNVIKNKNEVYLQIDCEESVSYELRDHFTFFVPGAQFTPQFRAKLWNGKIYLFDVRTKFIYRGLLPHIIKFFKDRNYSYSYEDDFDTAFSLAEANTFIENLNPKYQPRDYQIDAFVSAIRKKRALLLSPTASGKSLIIYLIIRYLLQTQKNGLIIVPNVSLVEQLYSDFQDYSQNNGWNVEDFVHRIYQGQDKDTHKCITISTWQSLHKLPPKYFSKFDFVIGDEAHQFKAKSLISIMTSLINAKYRIGTTGTLDGTKCFSGDTLISTSTGKKLIKDIEPNDLVYTLNETTYNIELKPVLNKFNNGNVEKLLRIQTSKGEIKVTHNHDILTLDGWKKAKDLTLSDKIISID